MGNKIKSKDKTSAYLFYHWDGEEQARKLAKSFKTPEVCPKCKYPKFIWHEDGYQCLNCFTIIYVKRPSNNGNGHRKGRLLLI